MTTYLMTTSLAESGAVRGSSPLPEGFDLVQNSKQQTGATYRVDRFNPKLRGENLHFKN